MLKALDVSSRGLINQISRNDLVSNNLANAATAGFRREIARVTREPVAGKPNETELVLSSATDASSGVLQRTGGKLDLAIEGDGFFVVEVDGEERFTRAGSFRLDNKGQVVNEAGHVLRGSSGPIQIESEEGMPDVAIDGDVSALGISKGVIRVVRFEDPAALVREGGNLFSAGSQQTEAVDPTQVRILSGFVEGSNVNPVREMVSMISALRAYQTMEKSVQSADELLDTMINRVGRLQGNG